MVVEYTCGAKQDKLSALKNIIYCKVDTHTMLPQTKSQVLANLLFYYKTEHSECYSGVPWRKENPLRVQCTTISVGLIIGGMYNAYITWIKTLQ